MTGIRQSGKRLRTTGGYSLVEVLVAIALFGIVMSIIIQVFSAFFYAYRNARTLQRDLENVQLVVNLMSKEIRTGTIVDRPHLGAGGHGSGPHSDAGAHPEETVQFFDHSQQTCIRYAILPGSDGYEHLYRGAVAWDLDGCRNNDIANAALRQMATGRLAGTSSFYYFPSKQSAGLVGFFAVYLELSQGTNLPVDRAFVQTMVSLRDYGVSGVLEP